MPRYVVQAILSRTYSTVTVEAEDEFAAREAAIEIRPDAWETSAASREIDIIDVSEVEEDDDDGPAFTRYLVVSGRGESKSVEAYLYSDDMILSHAEGDSRIVAVVQIAGSDEINAVYRQDYVAQRLSSGMFGVKRFDKLDEANAESVVMRATLGV